MSTSFEDQIRELLASGHKIAAFRLYREETGAGLAEAKAVVESLESSVPLTEPAGPEDPALTNQVVNLLGRGEKIEAIKLYRQHLGVGLKEAKEAVEQIGEQHGIPSASGAGCLAVVLLSIGVVIGLLF